jgi:DNA-binding transcriptional LysR family regulator
MDTSRLVSLVAAADLGSLTEASRQLGARLSTISRHITDLEAEVGEALLVRTGRGVRTTPAGEQFVERARLVLSELESAVAEARGARARVPLHLRVSAPTELALSALPPCIAALRSKHPELTLDLHSGARRVSLLEENFDAAIRLGPLASSDLVARRLGQVRMLVCAAPRPSPVPLQELAKLPFAGVAGTREQLAGKLRGRAVSVRVRPRIRLSTFTEAAELAASTDLAVVLPAYTAERFLRAKRLENLLPELTFPAVEVYMLIPKRHRETTVLRDLADLVATRLREIDGGRTRARASAAHRRDPPDSILPWPSPAAARRRPR